MQTQRESTTRPESVPSGPASARPAPAGGTGSAGSADSVGSAGSAAPSGSGRGGASPAGGAPAGRRASRPSTAPRESAFSALFLERARRREAEALSSPRPGPGEGLSETPIARRARWSGPWTVERVPAGDGFLHAVVRREEPAAEGGGARLACVRRQDALLGAAAFAAVAAPNLLSVNTGRPSRGQSPLGLPLHEGGRHLGHVSPCVRGAEGDFLAAYHAVRSLAASPDAAALFLAALDPEALAMLGRAAMRRLTGG